MQAQGDGERSSRAPVRVLLVDDQALFRGALAAMLATAPDYEVVGEASDGQAGLEAALRLRPDLVLLDVEMPRRNGIDTAEALLRQLPGIKVVMLTVSDDHEHLLAAVRLGVQGYVLKHADPDEFFTMLDRVMRHEATISPELLGRLLTELRTPATVTREEPEALSPRELEIMRLVAQGLTNREVGQRLFITEGTVKNHVHNALSKLHLRTRGQAAAYLAREGLLEG